MPVPVRRDAGRDHDGNRRGRDGRQAGSSTEDRKRGRVESCGHGRTRLHGLAMTGHGPAHSC